MTTWKTLLQEAFEKTGDPFSGMVTTLTKKELNREFDNDLGVVEGVPFTAWGDKYVYFPLCYDGSEEVGYAPRNPCDVIMKHQPLQNTDR